jgi:hypothetical protein
MLREIATIAHGASNCDDVSVLETFPARTLVACEYCVHGVPLLSTDARVFRGTSGCTIVACEHMQHIIAHPVTPCIHAGSILYNMPRIVSEEVVRAKLTAFRLSRGAYLEC